jgi:hypothetical protein
MLSRRLGGVMSDHQPLSVKETFDIYNSTLRLVGAANATGAIAAGAAFQAFEKIPGAQPYIKNVVLVFLFGVLLFTFSSATLFIAQSELDRYFAASRTKERADWEKIISGITKPPETHLRDAKKNWIVALLTGFLSVLLFLGGLAMVMFFVVGL